MDFGLRTRLVRPLPERARLRDRELSLRRQLQAKRRTTEDCFGATPKPARGTLALTGTSLRDYFLGVAMGEAARAAPSSIPKVQCASTLLP